MLDQDGVPLTCGAGNATVDVEPKVLPGTGVDACGRSGGRASYAKRPARAAWLNPSSTADGGVAA